MMSNQSKEDLVRFTSEELRAKRSRDTGSQTNWEKFRSMTEEEIEAAIAGDPDSDPPITEENWAKAELVRRSKDNKVAISLRVDPDVLAWFKEQGNGYQTRMNDVLRTYMRHHKKKE